MLVRHMRLPVDAEGLLPVRDKGNIYLSKMKLNLQMEAP